LNAVFSLPKAVRPARAPGLACRAPARGSLTHHLSAPGVPPFGQNQGIGPCFGFSGRNRLFFNQQPAGRTGTGLAALVRNLSTARSTVVGEKSPDADRNALIHLMFCQWTNHAEDRAAAVQKTSKHCLTLVRRGLQRLLQSLSTALHTRSGDSLLGLAT
jgi:hypothetical protein